MKIKSVWVGIILIVTVLSFTVLLAGSNIKEYSGQKWEYAQAYYFKDINYVYVILQDDIELASINATLTGIKDEELQSVVILNIFGSYGWELVETNNSFNTEENSNLLIFTFKRLI